MNQTGDISSSFRLPRARGRMIAMTSLVLAVGSGALALSRWEADPRRFLYAYLTALVFVISLSIGSLAWLMLQHLTGAVWSIVLRRLMENLTRPLPGR